MSGAPVSKKAAIRLVLDGWRSQNWTDTASAAAVLVDAHAKGQSLSTAVPDAFCVRNGCTATRAATVAANYLRGAEIRRAPDELPTLIYPEEIESFVRIREVRPQDVATIARPLPISEIEVKRLLLEIIGEAEVPGDWGGERSDAFTTNVVLNGQRIATSFVLKGPSKAGELSPADYGKNGDQIERSFTQPASLHVIQSNASLTSAVYELATGLVLNARRSRPDAVASVWDATDTARILAAYGKIDPTDGRVLG